MVTNPHIKQVYNAYYHAFHTLIKWDEVKTIEQNRKYAELLQRLVDQHSKCTRFGNRRTPWAILRPTLLWADFQQSVYSSAKFEARRLIMPYFPKYCLSLERFHDSHLSWTSALLLVCFRCIGRVCEMCVQIQHIMLPSVPEHLLSMCCEIAEPC